MSSRPVTDLYHGLFEWHPQSQGPGRLVSSVCRPASIPDPNTGEPIRVAAVEVSDRGVCPACAQLGAGGYVSFVSDQRLAFACPRCRKLVWIAGA